MYVSMYILERGSGARDAMMSTGHPTTQLQFAAVLWSLVVFKSPLTLYTEAKELSDL